MLTQVPDVPSTPRPLGPGDDDPRSPAVAQDADRVQPLGPGDADRRSPAESTAAATPGPLGPGDDDPRSPASQAALQAAPPLGPGDGDPNDGRVMLAPPPAGPGGVDSGPRHLTHLIPKRPTMVGEIPVSVAPTVEDDPSATGDAPFTALTRG